MGRSRRIAAAWAGPALIAAATAFALRGFVFEARLTDVHPDLLTFWLPRWAFLGRSLASGHVPLWNPFELTGTRFAADPQSGWLYLPPMALFSTLGPGTALRAFIVANPLLAGLGLFTFLRVEGLSRPAATAGGLSLAVMIGGSEIAVSLPFAGTLAWTPLVLLGAAGYRRASRWSRRLLWMALGGLAWSQVANAHMSHGLVVCTTLVAAYLVAATVSDVHDGAARPWPAVGRALLFLAWLPVASLPVLIPRLAFIGSSSLRSGYDALGKPARSIAGIDQDPIVTNGVWAGWPLAFGSAPGAYAGAVILLAAPLALRARRRRTLVWALGGALALTYLLMLNAVVTAGWFRSLMLRVPFGDVYLHNPGRLRYLALLAIPILGAVGIQGVRDSMLPWRRVVPWLLAGTALWWLVPQLSGATPVRFALLGVALPVAGVALALAATRRAGWGALAVVGVLTVELVASAAYAQTYRGDTVATGMEGGASLNLPPQPLGPPDVSQAEFLRPTAFLPIMREAPERFMPWAPPAAAYQKGYLFMQEPPDWPALAMERGSLFGVRDALGYNPVQLPRYWAYLRTVDPLPMFYNAAVVNLPTPSIVDLLGVRYLTVPDGVPSPLPGDEIVRADGYRLIELDGWEPRASVVPAWSVVPTQDAALHAVAEPDFDPGSRAILESDPGLPRSATTPHTGEASYDEAAPEDVRVTVDAGGPSILLIRTAWDEGWSATVDGVPAPVLPADAFLQGVPVSEGHHETRLTYHDADVTRGLLAGALVWIILAAAWIAAVTTERRRRAPQGERSRPALL